MLKKNYKVTLQCLCSARYMFAFFAIVVCPIIGMRSLNVGSDTLNYANYFSGLVSGEYSSRFEIGFRSLSTVIATVTDNHVVYFYIIGLVVAASLTISMQWFYLKCGLSSPILFAAYGVPFIISSSWFVNATINGLRQGVSLSILYAGCVLLIVCNKPKHALAVIITSVLFHYTSIFPAIFILLVYFLSVRLVFVIYILAGIGYPLGLNEQLVKVSSNVLSIDLHASIVRYAGGIDRWHGWQWDLFLYTVFWGVLYMVCIPLVQQQLRASFVAINKIYMALCLPYFFFGFGSFSNRWGFTAWLFLPILHFAFLTVSRFSLSTKILFSAGLFLTGVLKFLSLMQLIELPVIGSG